MHDRLIECIRRQYRLNWNGIHGIGHWLRVSKIGRRLSEAAGADARIVELFAFIHDACRLSDVFDPQHGKRAALFAESINHNILLLPIDDLEILKQACTDHSAGKLFHQNITVMTCWDSDRLDLGRVGIEPKKHRLCTDAAKKEEFFVWATGLRYAADLTVGHDDEL
jgi:uncharacterized protein